MKQVLVKGGKVEINEVPPPGLSDGMALVAVSHSLISSGTESGFVSDGGTAGYVLKKAKDPLNIEKVKRKIASVGIKGTLEVVKSKIFEYQAPGYSTAGTIVECAPGVPGLRVGDRVACSGVGYASHAAYNAVPHQLITPIPEGVSFEEAAFVTLGAIAMQGVRRAEPTFGETIVVSGLGLLGQLACQIARAAGCRVIGCDPIAEKRALAEELGADAACAPGDLEDVVAEWTGGYGADAVLVCAAAKGSEVTNQALDCCRQKGRVVVVGAVGMQLQREPLYMKELDFRLSCSYGPGRYNPAYEEKGLDYPIGYVRWTEGRNMAEFLRMVAEGKVRVKPLISVERPVEEADTAYETILSGSPNAIAALIRYDTPAAHPPPARRMQLRSGSAQGEVGVALIGAGAFASAYHLPSLGKIPGARVEAVVARTGGKAKQAAEKHGARYCATDYREVLADDQVNAVVVATRHNLHAEIALAAIDAGKHVFAEKPLALTVADCERIAASAAEKGVLVSVGFNRRFSAHARALKAATEASSGPKVMLYRCNAGPLPPDHWTRDPETGGGRILGEGVHFFDFLRWLAGSEAVSVEAARIGSDSQLAPEEDNLSVHLRFADGSLGTVLYTTVGNLGLGKERVEVFAGGGAAVIDDFRGVRFAGMPGKSVQSRSEDKGQFAIMANFIAAIRGETELSVTAEDGLAATRIALDALASAAS